MPLRYIEIPPPVTFLDPITKEELTGPEGKLEIWDFKLLLNKIMSNPKWTETYAAMRAQASIENALNEAKDGVMVLSEEDWLRLKEAVEMPRTQLFGTNGIQVIPGFGAHPTLGAQLLPLLAPIVEATTERVRKVAEKPAS